jgi:hypothetical protein
MLPTRDLTLNYLIRNTCTCDLGYSSALLRMAGKPKRAREVEKKNASAVGTNRLSHVPSNNSPLPSCLKPTVQLSLPRTRRATNPFSFQNKNGINKKAACLRHRPSRTVRSSVSLMRSRSRLAVLSPGNSSAVPLSPPPPVLSVSPHCPSSRAPWRAQPRGISRL